MNLREMQLLVLLLLAVTLQLSVACNSCSQDCCTTATCCQKSSSCCQTQSNCCQTQSNCCQKQSDCCSKKSECCEETKTPTTVSPTAPTPTGPTSPPIIPPSKPNAHTSNIQLENTIHNVNNIKVPVTLSNVNVVNVHSVLRPSPISPVTITDRKTIVDVPKKEIRVIHVPYPYPVRYPIYLPAPRPVQQGCCVVLMSHLSQQLETRDMCGSGCQQPYMFESVNPCMQQTCYKKKYWARDSCTSHGSFPFMGCNQVQQGCSGCNQDFYQNYNTYMSCRGCFHH